MDLSNQKLCSMHQLEPLLKLNQGFWLNSKLLLFLLTGCYGDQFECGSGECLHKKLQCDDYVDCDDGSDENADMCGKINT